MPIDPRQISHLLAVAEHGSFTRAASAQGISQPGLSNSIGQLERRLRVKVLKRSKRGSTLTNYGEILVRRAREVQALLKQAEDEVRLQVLGVEGPLSIGATPSVIPKWLPDSLNLLVSAGGPMDVSIIEGSHDALLPLLLSGQLDVVVGPVLGASSKEVIEQAIVDDPYFLAVGPKSSVARRKHVKLEELRDAPWVLPRPGTAYSRQIEAIFLNANIPWPRDCFTSNSLSLVREIVCMSNRVSIMSRLRLIGTGDGHLRGIPLDIASSRPLGYKVLRNAKLSSLAERFLIALRRTAPL